MNSAVEWTVATLSMAWALPSVMVAAEQMGWFPSHKALCEKPMRAPIYQGANN